MIRTHQLLCTNGAWQALRAEQGANASACQLVLVFGSRDAIGRAGLADELSAKFPEARIVVASTAGEILGDRVLDDTVVATGLAFERTAIQCGITNIRDHRNSEECGAALMRSLPSKDLSAVLVFSDGSLINGSELIAGMNRANEGHAPITGGLAGDGQRFERTLCGLDGAIDEGNIVVIGLYGTHVKVGHGSSGGWEEFGPQRIVSYSEGNILFTIDGRNALSLYKEHLGPDARNLAAAVLLFPLSLRMEGSPNMLVRTITSLNEGNDSMTFAGDMPVGSRVRMMTTDFDKLVAAAAVAARDSSEVFSSGAPEFALIVSCVGRKMILKGRCEDEIAAVRRIVGPDASITGFYSYGELAPFKGADHCDLHNQSMAITTLSES